MRYPKYVKTADGYIGRFQSADPWGGALYRFPGGDRYADGWEIANGSDSREELENRKDDHHG